MDNPEGTLHEKDVRSAVLREYAALYDRLVDSNTGVGAVVHLFTYALSAAPALQMEIDREE